MSRLSTLALAEQLIALGRLYRKSLQRDNSYAGEYEYLKKIIANLNLMGGYVVDVAASDGVSQSCTFGFFEDSNWIGLAVEMDPSKFSRLAFVYADFPNVSLARCRVTPQTAARLMQSFEVPFDFTLLNLDIDSYDLHVIDELLKADFRPRVISMEINEKIPPPIFFTVDYDDAHYWQGDHFFGCSLTAASSIVRPHGYILESLQYNNAIFIRTDIAGVIFRDVNNESAYDAGYRNRSDRKNLFPWNSNVDCLLEYSTQDSIEFLNRLFEKYRGKYTLHR
jgi:hypothetical protein